MSPAITITELRSMQIADLHKELRAHQTHVRKMRMQITMNTEKDTGRYRQEKKQLARMMMVIGEKQKETKGTKESKETKEPLKKSPATAKVAVSKKPRKTSKASL
ncbi:MAG: 50S ribosomal protein L29 [Candidatus Peribacteraceae bacterium]|nr:50S ribosomal protein L29 [Candidatus Peribacteraceae bacterium]